MNTLTKQELKDKLVKGELQEGFTRMGYHVLKNVSNCNRKDDTLTIGKELPVKVYKGQETTKQEVTKTVVVGMQEVTYTKEVYPDTGEGFSENPATMGMVDTYKEGTREYFLSREDKEDIIQDTLVKLYSKIDDILQSVEEYCQQKEKELTEQVIVSYFGTMVRYAAIDYARIKRLPSVPYAQIPQRELGQVPAIFDDILNRQYLKEVLSHEEHEVITRYLAGYRQKEIIDVLKTYKKKIQRIEKKAGQALTGYMKEEILHAVINANYKVYKEDKLNKRDKLTCDIGQALSIPTREEEDMPQEDNRIPAMKLTPPQGKGSLKPVKEKALPLSELPVALYLEKIDQANRVGLPKYAIWLANRF